MAEDIKNLQNAAEQEENGASLFDFQAIIRALVLNWQWFVLSIIICLGLAYLKLRYTTPVYVSYAQMFVKAPSNGNGLSVKGFTGEVVQSYGLENEKLILKSNIVSTNVVRDLKLYTEYRMIGRIREAPIYLTQPISVDIDAGHLEKLNAPINLEITRDGDEYHIEGTYYVPIDEVTYNGPFGIKQTLKKFPTTIRTKAGYLSFSKNGRMMEDGETMAVTINNPSRVSGKYSNALNITELENASIFNLSLTDVLPLRAMDYLRQLVVCYNRQANEDKNETAIRTEDFINDRIAKISGELNTAESSLESFKRQQNLVELRTNAREATANLTAAENKLRQLDVQVAQLNDVANFVTHPSNKYKMMPANVAEGSISGLIAEHNALVTKRNQLLRSAGENNPAVEPLTQQLDELESSIAMTLSQARHNLDFQRSIAQQQLGQYQSEVTRSPLQERVLTQIGRQQEVKSGLYLSLLQKREENSISLASTADKGRMINDPKFGGQVSPVKNTTYLTALAIGLAIPSLALFLIYFFRYRIEGHDDVAKLTDLPILADVAVANDVAKTKGDIVVHENQNNQMEEIFRAMRTNLQFMLKEKEKVILFTSTTSGEGKTFNAANLAVSFALLHKKVILVGLDIRKPRLAEQFELDNHHNGITVLLTRDEPTWNEVQQQILPSGVHDNLDLLLAGPIPPNPTELVSRPSLEVVMNHLREHYDYIIVDTAPVGLVTDTLQIGRVCDATVYMCRADYTPKSSFELINGLNFEKKLPNMSIVINGIDMSKKKYGYYYGYGRYGKYGKYGRYGRYGRYGSYGKYGSYGSYGSYGYYGSYGMYGNYGNSHYHNSEDNSVKV